jgi:purine-binding chemotaxis protein CheW
MSEQLFTTFVLNGDLYGVDAREVQEVIRYQSMTEVPLAPSEVSGLINLRGQVVVAIDLRDRLGLPPRPEGQLPMNVVVRTEDGALSFLVDQIGDVLHVDDDNLAETPPTIAAGGREFIAGVYTLDRELLLVLDVERIGEPQTVSVGSD